MPYNRPIYIINWPKLAHWFTPVHWRFPKLLSWVKAVAGLSNDLYNRFMAYRNIIKYRLLITPQVCYMEKALNDNYDIVQRRIYIDDGPEFLPVAFFRAIENKPVPVFRKSEDKELVLYRRAETAQFGVDFIIHIPSDVVFDMPQLRAFVTGYKLTTKTFGIQIF
ncbi:MAG: hypothetical protein ACT4OJ_01310 [Bacteroidota bacterium]